MGIMRVAMVLAFASSAASHARAADGPTTFSGRVIEKDGGAPIPGATVLVARSLAGVAEEVKPPVWAGETKLRTNADGRFTLTFTPEEVAEPRVLLHLVRVAHPEFVARESYPQPLEGLLLGRSRGEKPYFDTITLERGTEYFGTVVGPSGEPAGEVDFKCYTSSNDHFADFLSDAVPGRTDAKGRFRVRKPRTHAMWMHFEPERYSPLDHPFELTRPPDDGDVVDLGRVVLQCGTPLSGRVLDHSGRPISSIVVVAAQPHGGFWRKATTDAEGTFKLPPVPPGECIVFVEGQYRGTYFSPYERPLAASTPPIGAVLVSVRSGKAHAPIELRELESVNVEVRFVDSSGRPVRGGLISLSGKLLEQESFGWGVFLAPDAGGRVVFRAPKGLRNARLYTTPFNETVGYKTRLEAGGPMLNQGGARLGDLRADRPGVTIVTYRAPTLWITVETEDGSEPFDAEIRPEVAQILDGNVDPAFVGGPRGETRFCTRSLLPDVEYRLTAQGKGYVPSEVRRLSLPEGATAEVTLFVRRTPSPLRTGDPAPPFTVKTQDRRVLGLAECRGKIVLLHFWDPLFKPGDVDVPQVQAAFDRFGKDERLVILGLCQVLAPEDAAKAIDRLGLAWPQTVLLDAGLDAMTIDYGATHSPRTVLVGPEGTIVATDLKGKAIVEAVARALQGDPTRP
jgi:peroxiredoxin